MYKISSQKIRKIVHDQMVKEFTDPTIPESELDWYGHNNSDPGERSIALRAINLTLKYVKKDMKKKLK